MPKIIKLKNGLQVVLKIFQSENCIFAIYANAGVIYEQADNLGISHFVEHLFTAGFTQNEINLSKYYDFYTADDLVNLTFHFSSSKIDFFLNKILKTLRTPSFTKQEIENERKIILNELQQDEDALDRNLYTIYQKSIFGNSPLGTKKNIKKFTFDDLWNWHKKIFAPQNCVICLTANKKILSQYSQKILAELEKLTNDLSKPQTVLSSEIIKNNLFSKKYDRQDISVYGCFSLLADQLYLANLAYAILKEKFFLFTEKQGLYDCYLGKHEYNYYFQIWYYHYLTNLTQSKKILSAQLDFFQSLTEIITEKDLQKAKEEVLFDLETQRDSIFRQIDFVCLNLLKGVDFDLKKITKQYFQINLADVIAFLRKFVLVSQFKFCISGKITPKILNQYKQIIYQANPRTSSKP